MNPIFIPTFRRRYVSVDDEVVVEYLAVNGRAICQAEIDAFMNHVMKLIHDNAPRTPWFPLFATSPESEGMYEVAIAGRVLLLKWSGVAWLCDQRFSPSEAARAKWRGLVDQYKVVR